MMTGYQIAFVIILTVVLSLEIRLLYMGRSFLQHASIEKHICLLFGVLMS